MIDQLDHAVRSALADIVATTPEASDPTLARMPSFAGHRSRRVPVLIGSVALAAAASLMLVVVANRDTRPSDAPSASGPDTSGTNAPAPAPAVVWPVRLAAGLTPWYEANDPVTAALGAPGDGMAQNTVQCPTWTAADGVVNCTALTSEGYLPTVGYNSGERYVEIATLHSDIGIEAYANNYSHGKDVSYDEPPLLLQDVAVGALPAKLVETAAGVTRVTFEPVPGTMVSVEVGGGLTRDDALTIAAGVRPTAATPTIPLVIAQSAPDADGLRVTALGGVRDGNVCLLTDDGCATLVGDQPLLGQQAMLGKFGFVGLASADVAALRVTTADGTTTYITLASLPVGTVKAFALTDGVTVVPIDVNGTPIALVGGSVLTVPQYSGEVTATTSMIVDTTVVIPAGTVTSAAVLLGDVTVAGDQQVGLEIGTGGRGFCTIRRATGDRGCDGLPGSTSPAYVLTAGWSATQQLVYGLVDDGLTATLVTASGETVAPMTESHDGRRGFALVHPYGEAATVVIKDAAGNEVSATDVVE